MSSLYRYFFPSKSPSAQLPSQSSQPGPRPVDPQRQVTESVHRLRISLATLTSKELALQTDINSNRQEAKNRLKLGDKRNAQLYLIKAGALERNLTDTVSNKLNIESQISTLQNSSFTNQLITDLEHTRASLRSVSQYREPAYVQSLVQDVSEEMNRAASIQNSLSAPLVGIDDVSDQLAQLQRDIDLENEIKEDLALLELPSIPSHSSTSNKNPAPINQNMPLNKNPIIKNISRSVGPTSRGPRVIKLVNGVIKDSMKDNI